MRPLTLSKVAVRCGILALILFVVVVIALKFGAVPVSLYGLAKDLIGVLIGRSSDISSEYGMIIREIRLPRIALGIFVGASLSVAGTSFQALLRNPLADPYVLGVSYGAAVGAVKLGLFSALLVFLKKGWKLLIIAFAAVATAIKKFFARIFGGKGQTASQ